MVGNNIDTVLGAFEVMVPDLETLEDCEEFLIVGVVIALRISESVGVECNGMDFAIGSESGYDTGKGVVGGICFNDHRVVG